MDTSADVDVSRTASWDVFHHLGTMLERTTDVPARGRPRHSALSIQRASGSPPATRRWGQPWENFHVVISHASPIVAEGLLTTLSRHTGVTASICSGEQALGARLSSGSPCLVFSDYACAVAGARQLDTRSSCAWACVTTRDREPDIREALSAGVFGYLLADCAISDYVECVHGVGRESRFLCQRARQQLSETPQRQGLSARETAVLRLVVQGCSNQDIGEQLHITLSTVKVHVGQILKKLGARSRTQAAALAAAMRLLG